VGDQLMNGRTAFLNDHDTEEGDGGMNEAS